MLRDHFTEIADEMKRTLADAVNAAGNAAKAGAAERDQRVRQLTIEEKRLADLQKQAGAVLGELSAGSRSAA